MSGTHKYPTISFRISSREREEIEAKIFTSGMKKKDVQLFRSYLCGVCRRRGTACERCTSSCT